MLQEQELLNLYVKKGLIIDNTEIIVFKEYCLDYIQSSKQLNLCILGIDGYILENNTIKVNLFETYDFSKSKKNIQNCYSLAEQCISNLQDKGKSDGYIFTFDDKSTLSYLSLSQSS